MQESRWTTHRCTSILVRWYYSYYAQTQAPGPGPSPETPYCALTSSALSHYHHHRISLFPPSSSPVLSSRPSRAAYSLKLVIQSLTPPHIFQRGPYSKFTTSSLRPPAWSTTSKARSTHSVLTRCTEPARQRVPLSKTSTHATRGETGWARRRRTSIMSRCVSPTQERPRP